MASPSANVVLGTKPLYLQGTGSPGNIAYDAQSDRKVLGDISQGGVVRAAHGAVTFVSGLTVRVAAGIVYVLGSDIAEQGMYRQFLTANVDIAVGAGHATLPRIDSVVVRVFDDRAQANGLFESRVEVIPGTPTSGAQISDSGSGGYLAGVPDLTTLTGPVSKSVTLLAHVWVPAAAGALTSTATNILDMRSRVMIGKSTDALLDPYALAQRGALDGQVIGYDTTLGRSTWLNAVPVGTVIDYAGPAIPTGFLTCNGGTISRTTYARLYSALTLVQNGTLNNTINVTGLTSTTEIGVGHKVEGTGIPANTTVASIVSATAITLSAAATSTGTVSLRFFPYGNGDGSTTFNVPDFRGRIATGQGTNADNDKVGDSDALAEASRSARSHTHSLNETTAFGGGANTAVTSAATGISTNFPYLTVKKCIKY